MDTGSPALDISKGEIIKKLKSLARGVLYSLIVGIIVVVSHLNIPPQYAFILPIVVVLLTNLSHTIKLYVTDTTIPLPILPTE